MTDPLSPCGVWRLVLRRLGASPGGVDGTAVLVRVEADGTMTVYLARPAPTPGIGVWRSAGRGRVVMVCEWFTDPTDGRLPGRVSVRAAAELSDDGRTCQARLQWHYIDEAGASTCDPVIGEASGWRLEP